MFKAKKGDQTVVVKRSFAKEAHEKALVLKEARIIVDCSHENIVKFHGFNGKTASILLEFMQFRYFGSDLIQALQISQNTRNLNRGTPAYIAPECLLQTALSANHTHLKQIDKWSLAMIAHCLCNPDSCHPK